MSLKEILFYCVCLLPFAFWVWMIVEIVKKESDDGSKRFVWLLMVFILNYLGALIYFFIRRPKRKREQNRLIGNC